MSFTFTPPTEEAIEKYVSNNGKIKANDASGKYERDKRRADIAKRSSVALQKAHVAALWGKRAPKDASTAGRSFLGDTKPRLWYPSIEQKAQGLAQLETLCEDENGMPVYEGNDGRKAPAWWERKDKKSYFEDGYYGHLEMPGGECRLRQDSFTFTPKAWEKQPGDPSQRINVQTWMRTETVYTVPLKDWWKFHLGDMSAFTPVVTQETVYRKGY